MHLRYAFLLLAVFCLVIPAIAADDRGIALRPVAPTGEAVAGEQWLLTIGIDNYLAWPRLKTAVNDARAVRDVLQTKYHFDKAHTIELFDTAATRKNILAAFRDLAGKVKPEDSLLIFYAGHGQLDGITKAGSWIPVESGRDDTSAWITNQTIKDYLNADAIKAKHVLLVSDSCFAGDFFRGVRGALPAVNDEAVKKAYQRSSRQALTSGGVEPVSDSGFGGNSVFSHFFIAALKENAKPYLVPSDLFPLVKSGVAQNAEQFPQLGSLHGVGGQEGGEFVFFLQQQNRAQELSREEQARRKEFQRLQALEVESAQKKVREDSELASREANLQLLEKQIAEMKARVGTPTAAENDSLDNLLAMVKRKEKEQQKLAQMRVAAEEEARERQMELDRIKSKQEAKRNAAIAADLGKYRQIVSSPQGGELKSAAWRALVANYSEAAQVEEGDLYGFYLALDYRGSEWESVSYVHEKALRAKAERQRVADERAAATRRVEEERRRKLPGKIVASSEPAGIKWYVGNELIGTTPGEISLPPGRYEVIFGAKNYYNSKVTVTVGPQQTVPVTAKMVKMAPTEQVVAKPPPVAVTPPVVVRGSAPSRFIDPLTGMEFVSVSGGCYQMGDTFGDGGSDEKPVHEVCVSDFFIGKTEVTQGQWKKVMGNNPSHFSSCGDDCPVEKVSWNDIQEFLRRLNAQTGKSFRLPTEAEWEYAARSGGKDEKYSGSDNVDAVAWYDDSTHPVGEKAANGLGLFDMSGNVWEWCSDRYGAEYYAQSPQNNPPGPSGGSGRVVRGGSWGAGPAYLRSACRNWFTPDSSVRHIGFRLAISDR